MILSPMARSENCGKKRSMFKQTTLHHPNYVASQIFYSVRISVIDQDDPTRLLKIFLAAAFKRLRFPSG